MSFLPKLICGVTEIPILCGRQQTGSEVSTERQETQGSQHGTEGEDLGWRTDTTRLQDLLKSYSNQDSVVFVK